MPEAADIVAEKVLLVDDDDSILTIVASLFSSRGIETVKAESGEIALNRLRGDSFMLAMVDIRMPGISGLELLTEIKKGAADMPVIIMTGESRMKNAIEAMKEGAFDYITKPFDIDEVDVIIDKALEFNKMRKEVAKLRQRVEENWKEEIVFIGKSRPIQNLFKTIGKVASSSVTVLIQGESGTGKELIAKLIHRYSGRCHAPFITVNASAIPKDLMESELFGFVRGAFTGATDPRKGKFQLANGGTLFLDEIGDLPFDLQGKLLRVMQEKEFYPLGSDQTFKTDVRVIAATNKNLLKSVREKQFREDLYHRLNVVIIKPPPLRRRVSDISELADFFLEKFEREMGTGKRHLSKPALSLLKGYRWPGNVRELENRLRRSVLLSPSPVLSVDDLSLPDIGDKGNSIESMIYEKLKDFVGKLNHCHRQELYSTIMPYMERPLIKLVLKKTGGNQVRTAEMLGINRNTLRKKMKELDIKIHDLF